MSDNANITPAAEAPKPTPPVTDPASTTEDPKVDETDWKAEARKWQARAKENKTAADELGQLKEAQKTAEQKAADREAAATKRAEEAEAKALRREIALDPTGDGKSSALSATDAALLDDLTDEDAMRRLARRLAASKTKSNSVPREGSNPAAGTDDARETVRGLFGG